MRDDLVFDIGMYDGADTAYYLRLGLRVVAVEADPELCELGRVRFSDAIAGGRLTIVHRAIVGDAEANRTVTLWVNPNNREWNTAAGTPAVSRHATGRVDVPTISLVTLFAEHGVPLYLKVDIEGMDRVCAEAINPGDRPRFVSLELCDEEIVNVLAGKGYRRFKCIRQADLVGLREGMIPPESLSPVSRWLVRRPASLKRKVVRLVRGKEAARAKKIVRLPDGGEWMFGRTSSGAFGEAGCGGGADGPWMSIEEFGRAWRPWREAMERVGESWPHWFDIHAAE